LNYADKRDEQRRGKGGVGGVITEVMIVAKVMPDTGLFEDPTTPDIYAPYIIEIYNINLKEERKE
jgi:hypothetical protein